MFPLRTETTLEWVKGPKVLDVGCTGHILEIGSPNWLHGRLRERFPGVVGVDISRENVEDLKKAGFTNLHVQSAESFELADRFDTIVAGELIEHLANPGLFLQQARAHLKPGGRLVLTTPNIFSLLFISYALLKYPKTCENLQHTCWFCPQTIKELVGRYGLRIEHFELFDDYPPGSPSWRYRLFVAVRGWFGFVLPKLLAKNRMLLVLVPEADTPTEDADRTRAVAEATADPSLQPSNGGALGARVGIGNSKTVQLISVLLEDPVEFRDRALMIASRRKGTPAAVSSE